MEIDKSLVEKIEHLAPLLKVCGHPLRLKILCAIEKNESCVTELWTCLNQTQPVVSQHLAVLKKRDIVRSSVRGNKRYYSIINPFIKTLVRDIILS
ncbi:MAG: winged helix-turn-helix transcriptional regulator [Spirochaetes bacterium]|nr:winged helix-turn-helix transcriptional regulator [Spirochaetota bacterium]